MHILCSHKSIAQLPYHHMCFKTRQQLCNFASIVSSCIEHCIMPPFDSDVFIIGVDNHVYRCMDSNINHFTNVRRPKNVSFTKGIAVRLAIKVFGMVDWNLQDDQGCLHQQSMMQLGLQTSHKHCFLHNIEANKQMITSHDLMVHACSSCQTNVILSKILLVFIQSKAQQNFGSLTKISK